MDNSLQRMRDYEEQAQDQTLSDEEREQAQEMADLELELWWAIEQVQMEEENA